MIKGLRVLVPPCVGVTDRRYQNRRFINAVPEPIDHPVAVPDRGDRVRYGKYLARMSACADCHTPMDQQRQPVPGMAFGGGNVFQIPGESSAAANITPDPSSISYYTDDLFLFLEMMRTGRVKARNVSDIMTPDQVLYAYRNGLFPMAVEDDRIGWFSPDPRGIIPLEAFHVPRRLARLMRGGAFEVRIDSAFDEVIRACAEHQDTWISREIREVYTDLHRLGYAHSVETWHANRLSGGLYGVSIGGAFFGESMFHRETDASKVALSALVDRLRVRDYHLLDTQWLTTHLSQFGAIEVPRRRYLKLLRESLALDRRFI